MDGYKMNYQQVLPVEIWLQIIDRLSFISCLRLSTVNKYFSKLIFTNTDISIYNDNLSERKMFEWYSICNDGDCMGEFDFYLSRTKNLYITLGSINCCPDSHIQYTQKYPEFSDIFKLIKIKTYQRKDGVKIMIFASNVLQLIFYSRVLKDSHSYDYYTCGFRVKIY